MNVRVCVSKEIESEEYGMKKSNMEETENTHVRVGKYIR